MDGVDRLVAKIRQDGQAQVLEIQRKSEEEIAQMTLEMEEQITAVCGTLKDESVKELENLFRIYESNRALENRNRLLELKQNLINLVFERSCQRLNQMEPEAYKAFMFKTLLSAVSTGNEEVLMSVKDVKAGYAVVLEQVNRELIRLGKTGGLKLSDERMRQSGGFIIRTTQYEVNYSFEALLAQVRDDLEGQVARILFE